MYWFSDLSAVHISIFEHHLVSKVDVCNITYEVHE